MNKFCFTQSESNKSYCKTQSNIIYIPLLIFLNCVNIFSQLLQSGELFSPITTSQRSYEINACLHVSVRINF